MGERSIVSMRRVLPFVDWDRELDRFKDLKPLSREEAERIAARVIMDNDFEERIKRVSKINNIPTEQELCYIYKSCNQGIECSYFSCPGNQICPYESFSLDTISNGGRK